MADGPQQAGVRGWLLIGLLLAGGALVAQAVPHTLIEWQPAQAASQPWRAWTAAFLHYSGLHLAANLAGLALVVALGRAARLPRRSAIAWAAAWPLTQLGLWLQPALLHYGGLSGVLHAGAAVAGLHLVVAESGLRRVVGVAIVAGLALKVVSESPWAGPLRQVGGWDIAIAPFAHASGLVSGLLCATLAELSLLLHPSKTHAHG